MPYASAKQARYFHAQKGKKVPASVVNEFDAATHAQGGIKKGKKKDTGLGDFMKGKGGK